MVKTEINAIHPAVFMNQPLAAPHQSFLTIGSEVPKGQKTYAFTTQRTAQLRKRSGGFYPPLQGVCVQPGTSENPRFRADSIRPYRAYAFNRVLAKNRGFGRILSAPY